MSIKEYFLTYNEALTNDFVLEGTARRHASTSSQRDIGEWRITFVDTGLQATIGERLKAVERYIGDDEVFLATYGDGLTDAPLDEVIDAFRRREEVMFLSVRPQFNAHLRDHGRRRDRDADRRHEPLGCTDQRRLLRLPPRAARLDRARGRARRGDVRRAHSPRRGRRLSRTTASSGRWTRSRIASGSRRCTSQVARPGASSDCTRTARRGRPDARALALRRR